MPLASGAVLWAVQDCRNHRRRRKEDGGMHPRLSHHAREVSKVPGDQVEPAGCEGLAEAVEGARVQFARQSLGEDPGHGAEQIGEQNPKICCCLIL